MRYVPTLAELRAARWANRALSEVRHKLSAVPLSELVIAAPKRLPPSGDRGVRAVLRLRRPSCLEAALVRQRWLAAHGVNREVIIGVGSPSEDFLAHAWIEGEEDVVCARFSELTRLAPR